MIPQNEGRLYRILTVVDNRSCSSPVLEADFRMSRELVSRMLARVLSDRPGPRSIAVDHGMEFRSGALKDWAYRSALVKSCRL